MNNKQKWRKIIWLTFVLSALLTIFCRYFGNNFNENKETNSKPSHFKRAKQTEATSSFEITVVSSYFSLNKSKHSHKEYDKWIGNFFQSVTNAPLVLFTDGKSISKELLDLRHNLTTKLYIVDSHWNILEEIEEKRGKTYSTRYKREQHQLDPEKSIHCPDLYVLWNMKSFITNKIAHENPYRSSVFIYTDAGAWRDKPLLNWPNVSQVTSVSKLIGDKILFGQISNFNLEKSPTFPLCNIIEGTFFMGSPRAISYFENQFWKLHDQRFDQGMFIGKDQTLMNIMAFNSATKNSIARLKTWDIGCPVDIWFFYQYFFADEQFYECKRPKNQFLIF